MADYPNTSRGDVQAWSLTHAQASHYYARISTYYARRARRSADLSKAYAAKAERLYQVAFGLALLALVMAAIGALL